MDSGNDASIYTNANRSLMLLLFLSRENPSV